MDTVPARRREVGSRRATAASSSSPPSSVYLASPVRQVADSRYTLLVSEALYRHHTVTLDRFFREPLDPAVYPGFLGGTAGPGSEHPYQLQRTSTGLHYRYGLGGPVLSVPFVIAFNAAGLSSIRADGRYDARRPRSGCRPSSPPASPRSRCPCCSWRPAPSSGRGPRSCAPPPPPSPPPVEHRVARPLEPHLGRCPPRPRRPPRGPARDGRRGSAAAPRHRPGLGLLRSAHERDSGAGGDGLGLRALAAGGRADGGGRGYVARGVRRLHLGEPRGADPSLLPGSSPQSRSLRRGPARAARLAVPRTARLHAAAALRVFLLAARHARGPSARRITLLTAGIVVPHVLVLAGMRRYWAGHAFGSRVTTELVPWLVLLGACSLAGAFARAPRRCLAPGRARPRRRAARVGRLLPREWRHPGRSTWGGTPGRGRSTPILAASGTGRRRSGSRGSTLRRPRPGLRRSSPGSLSRSARRGEAACSHADGRQTPRVARSSRVAARSCAFGPTPAPQAPGRSAGASPRLGCVGPRFAGVTGRRGTSPMSPSAPRESGDDLDPAASGAGAGLRRVPGGLPPAGFGARVGERGRVSEGVASPSRRRRRDRQRVRRALALRRMERAEERPALDGRSGRAGAVLRGHGWRAAGGDGGALPRARPSVSTARDRGQRTGSCRAGRSRPLPRSISWPRFPRVSWVSATSSSCGHPTPARPRASGC